MKPTFFVKTALVALSLALFVPLASADKVTFSGTTIAGDTFSGTFTVVADVNPANPPNAYDITRISGVVVVQGVTQYINATASSNAYSGPFVYTNEIPGNSPSGMFDIDDLYFSVGNAFDFDGPLAILGNGVEFNLYYDTLGNGALEESNGYNSPFATFTSTLVVPGPVPEPSSLALFGTGILGFAGVVRRRFKA